MGLVNFHYIETTSEQFANSIVNGIISIIINPHEEINRTYPWWLGYKNLPPNELAKKLNFVKIGDTDGSENVKEIIRQQISNNRYTSINDIKDNIAWTASETPFGSKFDTKVGSILLAGHGLAPIVGATDPYSIKNEKKVRVIWLPVPSTEFNDNLRNKPPGTKTRVIINNTTVPISFDDTLEFLTNRYQDINNFLNNKIKAWNDKFKPAKTFYDLYNKL